MEVVLSCGQSGKAHCFPSSIFPFPVAMFPNIGLNQLQLPNQRVIVGGRKETNISAHINMRTFTYSTRNYRLPTTKLTKPTVGTKRAEILLILNLQSMRGNKNKVSVVLIKLSKCIFCFLIFINQDFSPQTNMSDL